MADLSDLTSSQSVKIATADPTTGVESGWVPADFGASSNSIRVAALPGNANGIADFNAGATGAQTPRAAVNLYDSAGNVITSITTGDAQSDLNRGFVSKSYGFIFNGTTWDRSRDAGIGNNVSATGLLANAGYGQYTTTPPQITSSNYSAVQLDERGVTLVKQDVAGYNLQSKVFVAKSATVTIAAATTETPLFLFKNPNGSGLTARIFRMKFSTTDTSAARSSLFRLYSAPTITANGTSVTPLNERIKTSPTASTMTPFYTPTISGNGTSIWEYFRMAGQSDTILDFPEHLVVEANNNILVTVFNSNASMPCSATFWWVEV